MAFAVVIFSVCLGLHHDPLETIYSFMKILALAFIIPVVSALDLAPSYDVITISVTKTVWVDNANAPYRTQAEWVDAAISGQQVAIYTFTHDKLCKHSCFTANGHPEYHRGSSLSYGHESYHQQVSATVHPMYLLRLCRVFYLSIISPTPVSSAERNRRASCYHRLIYPSRYKPRCIFFGTVILSWDFSSIDIYLVITTW
jgi:hypothetical protein